MILVKTQAGQRAFKECSALMSPHLRGVFLLFDGQRSVGEVLAAGMGVVMEDIQRMIHLGLLGHPGVGEGRGAADMRRISPARLA